MLCPRGADGPRGGRGRSAGCEFVRCSSCSCSPFVSICRDFEFWLDEVSDGPQQRADGPRAPRGRPVLWGSLLVALLVLTDSPRPRPDGLPYLCGQSVVRWRTVREASADGPPHLAGRSARACELCFLVRFLPSFLVLPRVLQGIVPKARG
jgi:hypothetical protein